MGQFSKLKKIIKCLFLNIKISSNVGNFLNFLEKNVEKNNFFKTVIIRRLASLFSGKKTKKTGKEKANPVVSVPKGDTDQEIIQKFKQEMEKLMIEKQHLETKLERMTTCPICNEMVFTFL